MKKFIICIPATWTAFYWNKSKCLPFGALFLAEILLAKGWVVEIVDGITELNADVLIEKIDASTVAVGISTMSGTQLRNAVAVSKIIKSSVDVPIIWGGVHVTALPEQSLRNDYVDYIVWGEGELVICDLLDRILAGDFDGLLPGIGYKSSTGYVIGPNSGYTPLDRVFDLPYHLLAMDQYARELAIGAKREFQLWTSRGCPFRCSFCSNSSRIWPNTVVRYHSLEHIVRDARKLCEEYGADMLNFSDENFILNEARLMDIFKALRNGGIRCKFKISARIDQILKLSTNGLNFMRECGVVAIGTAPESGSQRVLNNMAKGISVEQIYQCDALLSELGFFKSYNFLVGTPHETIEDVNATLDLMCYLAKSSMCCPWPLGTLHKYLPLPGTVMFEQSVALGFNPPTTTEEWANLDFARGGFEDSFDPIRPWISETMLKYLREATVLVEAMNECFIGRGVDVGLVESKINAIRNFIEKNK